MPLTFNTGETKTFQLQAEKYQAYPRHWVGREYKPCSGAGCALCAAGVVARQDYMIPIAIAGVSDSYVFSSGVAQQLDSFTQQGYKLLGLMVKVTRTGAGRDTKYQVALAGVPAPVAGFTTPAEVLGAKPPAQPTPVLSVVVDAQSFKTADRWAELMQRLLYSKELLDLVAKTVQLMKDEGLWG